MVRTQVQLTGAQARALSELTASHGNGVSRDEQIRRALKAVGCFASGSTDVSAEHDRYLADAFRS